MSYGAPGQGRYITIYANPGHAYMVVHGRRFDTSGAGGPAVALAVGPCARQSGYTVRHPPGL